jgi:hypothetical protein
LSSARTQAGVTAESIEWKRESGLDGMPAFISK